MARRAIAARRSRSRPFGSIDQTAKETAIGKPLTARPQYAGIEEAELLERLRRGNRDAFLATIKRSNQRLFRVARAIVGEDSEAEDVVQEAYSRAFASLATFRGEASILTWLTRIVLNEANGRLRRRRRHVGLEKVEGIQKSGDVIVLSNAPPELDPEADAVRAEVRRALERAIDELPADFRIVFVMRDVEECSIAETAASLGIRAETVKTRLHRARRLLRGVLTERLASSTGEVFAFLGERCQRISERALARLSLSTGEAI